MRILNIQITTWSNLYRHFSVNFSGFLWYEFSDFWRSKVNLQGQYNFEYFDYPDEIEQLSQLQLS